MSPVGSADVAFLQCHITARQMHTFHNVPRRPRPATLPCQVDPVVFNMLSEDPGHVDYSAIGGLSEQIRRARPQH